MPIARRRVRVGCRHHPVPRPPTKREVGKSGIFTKPRQKSGQALLRDILIKLEQLSRLWAPQVQFQWLPGHNGIHGNEQAHTLAQQATEQIPMVSTSQAQSAGLLESQQSDEGKQVRFLASEQGKYTKTLDRCLAQPTHEAPL